MTVWYNKKGKNEIYPKLNLVKKYVIVIVKKLYSELC